MPVSDEAREAAYAAAPVRGGHLGSRNTEVGDLERSLTSWQPERTFAAEAERIAFVESLCGKHRDASSPSEESLRRRHGETLREDEPIGLRA